MTDKTDQKDCRGAPRADFGVSSTVTLVVARRMAINVRQFGETRETTQCRAHLPRRNALDLHQGALREGLDGDGAAGREGSGEELGVDFVHGGEVGHVGQEDGGLDHVLEAQAGRFENGARIGEALPGLDLDAAFGEGAGGRVDGQLPGNENDA